MEVMFVWGSEDFGWLSAPSYPLLSNLSQSCSAWILSAPIGYALALGIEDVR